MYLLLLTYKQPLAEVERHLAEHRAFLDKYYAAGEVVCSGPRDPRTGGVILCRGIDRARAEELVREDPFHVHGVADYEIIGFEATKCALGLELLK